MRKKPSVKHEDRAKSIRLTSEAQISLAVPRLLSSHKGRSWNWGGVGWGAVGWEGGGRGGEG